MSYVEGILRSVATSAVALAAGHSPRPLPSLVLLESTPKTRNTILATSVLSNCSMIAQTPYVPLRQAHKKVVTDVSMAEHHLDSTMISARQKARRDLNWMHVQEYRSEQADSAFSSADIELPSTSTVLRERTASERNTAATGRVSNV